MPVFETGARAELRMASAIEADAIVIAMAIAGSLDGARNPDVKRCGSA